MGQPLRPPPLLHRKAKGGARGLVSPAPPLPKEVGRVAARVETHRDPQVAPVLSVTSGRKPDAATGLGASTPTHRGLKAREARVAQALDENAVRPRVVRETAKGADRSRQGRVSRARPSPASSSHLDTASWAHNARFNMGRLPRPPTGEKTEVVPRPDRTRRRRRPSRPLVAPAIPLRPNLPARRAENVSRATQHHVSCFLVLRHFTSVLLLLPVTLLKSGSFLRSDSNHTGMISPGHLTTGTPIASQAIVLLARLSKRRNASRQKLLRSLVTLGNQLTVAPVSPGNQHQEQHSRSLLRLPLAHDPPPIG